MFTPTQTGLGERKHLLSRDTTLDTFVEDVANVLDVEDLRDVILVGHSFGGVPITGVADRMPERIRHLVYLDGVILQDGQSFLGSLPPEPAARRRAPAGTGWSSRYRRSRASARSASHRGRSPSGYTGA